jgi:hypothetical protein
LTQYSKVKGSYTAADSIGRKKIGLTFKPFNKSDSIIVVEYLPHYPKVEGSSKQVEKNWKK